MRGLRDRAVAKVSPDLDDSVHEATDGMPDDPSQSEVDLEGTPDHDDYVGSVDTEDL